MSCAETTSFLYWSQFIDLNIIGTKWDVVIGKHVVMIVLEKDKVTLLIGCYESMLSLFFVHPGDVNERNVSVVSIGTSDLIKGLTVTETG